MGTTSAPQQPRSSQDSSAAPQIQTSSYDKNPSGVAVGLAISMAWQLAIAVLVPIYLGHLADHHFHSSNSHGFDKSGYLCTLAGLFVGMLAMILIVKQTIKQLNDAMQPGTPANTDKPPTRTKKGSAQP